MSVVIDSVNRSNCLYCKIESSSSDFHEIFDEIGLELQLGSKITQFFGITVENDGTKQQLCDECVNRLIELFDLEEHYKETSTGTGEVLQLLGANAVKSEQREEHQHPLEEEVQSEYNEHNTYVDSTSSVADEDGSQDNHNFELPNDDYVDDESETPTDQQVYDQTIDNKSEILCGELDFAEDNERDDTLVGHTNDLTDLYGIEEEVEQQMQDDTLLAECDGEKPVNEEYDELITMEERQCQALDNEYFYTEEDKPSDAADEVFDEVNQEADDTIIEEVEENSMDVIDGLSLHDDIEAEYLIEETICFEEYDNVDLNEYLDNAIVTNFEDLQLEWTVECKLCLYKHYNFQELLNHQCVNELIGEEQPWCCIINECDDVVTDLKSLARHLITKHYNNVESVIIYGRCPECQKPFSNIVDFNKHSCCNIKRKAGNRNFCQACSMDFQSLKRYVFHMQFHLTKHRPKVCILCGAMFNNADDFFDHVNYSHEPDTAMACINCDRFFQDKKVFERHMACHDSTYSFECTHCPKKYTNRSGLTSHMDIYHNHEMKPLQCEYCYKEFVNQTSYRSHIKAHMPEAKVPAYICSECGLISNNADIIQSHIETDEAFTGDIIEKIISIAYTCECCSMDFFSARYLHHHRLSSKHSDKLYYCPICRKAFKTLKHMRNHLTSHKDYDEWLNVFPIARFYMCNIGDCWDAYPLWTSLYYHKKRHKNSEISADKLKCQFCEKACISKMSLAIHVARVHNNNNIKCEHCQKSYKNEDELQRHKEHMHVSVQCSECQKVFKNRRNLVTHEQLVHKNEKRYFCTHCGKGYYYKGEMKAHEKNVHPDTTYKCQLCNFVTNYPKSLDVHHVAKHTDDLPFKCTSCSKGFARKQLLTVHMKRHKQDKDFICYEYCRDGCNAAFITHFLLKKHIQAKHATTVKGKTKAMLGQPKEINASQSQILIIEDDVGDVELVLGNNANVEVGSEDDEYEIRYERDDDGEEDEIVDELDDDDDFDFDEDS